MKLAGVAGWPIAHSLSPAIYGYWLKEYKLEGAYLPLPVAVEHLPKTLQLLPKIGFVGMNLTLPHKETAFKICTELGVIDPAVLKIGAVNTLVFSEGRIVNATNTDGYGFVENLRSGAPKWNPEKTNAVLLGAGGASRGIIAALRAAGVPSICLLNRTRDKALQVAQDFSGVTVGDWKKPDEILANATLLINTTSLGMKGEPPLELNLDALPKSAIVTDIVYAPLETELLKTAKARGNKTVDGLGMLLHQAVPGFEAWFGVRPEVTPALRAHVLGK
jgi:shikimate dehydrogenase